jgi:drug/metabolite transporter (DMT)-like permease
MSHRNPNRQIIAWIVAGLVAWGVYLAVGDYLRNQNLLRSLVTLACVAAFLAMWLIALAVRRGREASDQEIGSE